MSARTARGAATERAAAAATATGGDAPAQEAVTDGDSSVEDARAALRASAWWWVRTAAVLLTLVLAIQLLTAVQTVLGSVLTVVLYVLFGAVIAFLAGPVVALLEERARMPRTPAILLVLLVGVGVVVGLGYLIASPIADEASQLGRQMPTLLRNANGIVTQLRQQLASHGIQLNGNGISGTLAGDLSARVAGALIHVVYSTVTVLLDILVTLVVAFWMLKDGEALRAGIVRLLPGRARSHADFAFDAFGVVVGGYVRGQLLMALILGALAGAGCYLIGVPFPLVVAVAAATFELVPLVGAFAGGLVAILLALTKSPLEALWAALLFIGIHIVEGYLLAPRIQARFVRLHPLVTLLALFAGIEIGGFLGALVAVPLASLCAVFVRAFMSDARVSRPDLFAERRDRRAETRRRRLLSEFRLFRRSQRAAGPKPDIDTVA